MDRTDDDIINSIHEKVGEINVLLSEAYSHDIEIIIDQYFQGTLGSNAPYSNLDMRAKKLLFPMQIRPSGYITYE